MVFLFPNANEVKCGGISSFPHAERIHISAVFAYILIADVHIDLQNSRNIYESRLVALMGSDDLGIHP
jgi:hypothetical protein